MVSGGGAGAGSPLLIPDGLMWASCGYASLWILSLSEKDVSTMRVNEPDLPVRYRVDEDWMQVSAAPSAGNRPVLDSDLLDDGGLDEPDAPERYWTLRRVIWIVMALLALVALLASVIAPLLEPRPGLPPPPPNTRDMVTLFMNWMA